MFVSVIFPQSKKRLVIPFKWVYSLDILQLLNGRHIRSKLHTIYYSNDFDEEPNFRLRISDVFDEHNPGCYRAQVDKFFGEIFLIFNFFELGNALV